MSILSTLGKIGSGIGKVALGAAGGVLNTATGGLTGNLVNANMFDKAPVQSVVPFAPAVVASLNGGDTQNRAGGSLLGTVSNFFGAATDFLTGRSHAQLDVHTEVGGTRDVYGNTSNGLPSWLLPVGIAAFVLFLFTGKSHR